MATGTFFLQFVEDLCHKVHDLETDQLKVALCTATNAPTSADSILTDLSDCEISYTNLANGGTTGRDITTIDSEGTDGSYQLELTDLVLTASGGAVATFRYIVIYNDTATSDNLIMFYDYGSDLDLADTETLTLNFGATTITIV